MCSSILILFPKYLSLSSVDACSNEECVLCKNAIRRPCSPDNIFQSKYIREKEPISAKCGGDVYIELVDCGTGKLLKEDLNVNLHFVTATTFRNRRTTEVTNGFDSSQISHWVKNNLLEVIHGLHPLHAVNWNPII